VVKQLPTMDTSLGKDVRESMNALSFYFFLKPEQKCYTAISERIILCENEVKNR